MADLNSLTRPKEACWLLLFLLVSVFAGFLVLVVPGKFDYERTEQFGPCPWCFLMRVSNSKAQRGFTL